MLALTLFAALPFLAQNVRAQDVKSGPWVMQNGGTTASLRGIHAVGGGVAWASGTGGTVLRTEDSGYMWQSCAMPPGAEKLDFRGIWAWDANNAVVMASGPGDQSRVYKTTDGCSHWTLELTNPDKDGFWDALVFQDRKTGFLLGDPVSGRFVVMKTVDGGQSWSRSKAQGLEATPEAKGAFAASNTSLVILPNHRLLFGTGGGVLYHGVHFESTVLDAPANTSPATSGAFEHLSVPLAGKGDAAGIFSLAFADALHGVAVGGDYQKPNESVGTAAWTSDGGKTWTAAVKPPHGYRSSVAWDADAKAWIAAGTNGSDISYDGGKTWAKLDDGNWNALSLPWIVGPKGRMAKLGVLPPKP
ncbi:hypothetical protein ESZ00_15125 [Silvibacterium dinghuense]|uniref:Photosynthesis system II assembly factor Ycf48/Hcf136-like domain-containing protein n=1 Tax=Silvibacterium dinghuense TaxID=1560006 RepID=A0A4Q1SCC5_9BACT|nr:hypothetical protein ESZ00_15125 [Silvibacterium dinghuense]